MGVGEERGHPFVAGLGQADVAPARVALVVAPLDEALALELAQPAQRGGQRHRGGDAGAGHRDRLVALLGDVEVEQDVPRRLAEQVARQVRGPPAAVAVELLGEHAPEAAVARQLGHCAPHLVPVAPALRDLAGEVEHLVPEHSSRRASEDGSDMACSFIARFLRIATSCGSVRPAASAARARRSPRRAPAAGCIAASG